MSGPFQPGDVVVCVAGPRDPRANVIVLEGPMPIKGKIYTIAEAAMTQARVAGVRLAEAYRPDGMWAADKFRHLPRATDEFTATIRACKPIRVGEPA